MTIKERISRLEEDLYFQERLMGELNAALVGQQRRIDAVERALEGALANMAQLRLILEEGGSVNAPPPHYQP